MGFFGNKDLEHVCLRLQSELHMECKKLEASELKVAELEKSLEEIKKNKEERPVYVLAVGNTKKELLEMVVMYNNDDYEAIGNIVESTTFVYGVGNVSGAPYLQKMRRIN